ncbi:hypothetical protein [Halorarum salinum]|uniref:Uncharacterized protein n=1 Tax=Halorarum salinum TaxID=2743089 RepID=A0A7D5QBN8_9EURY|nr:hypothetical protein [Halobaculum salinum]QLG61980.1 hypothetical protein HUG12_09705 [Halobaculum salinum]
MALSVADGRGPLPDSRHELLFMAVALALTATFVFAGAMVYVQQNPGAPWQLEAMYSSAFSLAGDQAITADTPLELPQEDAQYLNRVYRELNTRSGDEVGEQGYCLDVVNGRLSVQQAGTIEAREDRVTYTTANCLFRGSIAGTAHFHPPSSRPVLSGPSTSAHPDFNDKLALLESSHRFSCVQAGLMTTTPGDQTRAFRCYLKPASGEITDEFPEIRVEVSE